MTRRVAPGRRSSRSSALGAVAALSIGAALLIVGVGAAPPRGPDSGRGVSAPATAPDAAKPGAAPAPAPAAPNRDGTPVDLAAAIEPIRATHDLPALAAVVVGIDGVEAIGFTGVRAKGADDAIAATDRFHLGSCTKAMTATLAALLVRDGSLRWESTVGETLGTVAPTMHESWRGVTLEELLRHAGGAPAHAPREIWALAFACRKSSRDCRRAFVQSLLAAPISQPRGTPVYSNQGYAIAGAMLEAATDQEYEALITERLFEPLGITSAGFGPPPEARGHKADGTPVSIDNPSAIAPAGRVHMTMEDWAKFIALHLRRDGGTALPLVRADFDRLHSLVALPTEGAPAGGDAEGDGGAPRSPAEPPREGKALGWLVVERAWGGRVLNHAGSNTLWFCVAWVAPDRGFALLAATNSGAPSAPKACDEAVIAARSYLVAQKAMRKTDTAATGAAK